MIILAGILFTLLSAWIDAEHLKDKDYIESHASRVLLRTLFVMAVARSWYDAITLTLIFAVLFDHILNIMMKRNPFYLGTVAEWDKFWSEKKVEYFIFKLFCIGIIVINIYLKNK